MSIDEQEALSVSLSRGMWCVPLSSGRIAVFTHPMCSLRTIVDSWADAVALAPHTATYTARYNSTGLESLTVELDL